MENDIISKIKESNLTGRSGSCFPVALKWEAAKNAEGSKKYVVCNASEGEPGVFKDGFILEKYPNEVVNGIKLALESMGADSAYIYLKKEYFKKFKKNLEKLTKGLPISLFEEKGTYLAGEETALCESIEGRFPEPRLKPPYPFESGLFGCPTLINNVETFYCVSKISKGDFEHKRFYSISGKVKNKGVFELPEDWTAEKILKETGNYPKFRFFAQIGGGASGIFLRQAELNSPVTGAGSIIVFNEIETDPFLLLEKLSSFFLKENCDKCAPCREGVFRIREMSKKRKLEEQALGEIFQSLEETSFCSLGKGVSCALKSLVEKMMIQKQISF